MDFFLNIPILSILLLTAGVLIGNMIWGRGQREGEEQIQRLRTENDGLQTELSDQKNAFTQLEQSLELHRKDASRLKATNRQLEQLREQHKTLQNALSQAEQNATRVQTLSDKLQTHVASFHEERDQFVEAVQIRLEDQSKQIERLTRERDEAVSNLGQSRGEVSGLKSTVQHQAEELKELRAKYARSSGLENDVTELRRKLEDVNSDFNREKNQREHLQSVLDGRKIEYDALLQDIEQLESSFQKMCLQNEKLTEESSLLATLRIEHAELTKDLERLRRDHSDLENDYTSLKHDYTGLKQDHTDLKEDHADAQRDLAKSRQEAIETQRELDNLRKSYSGLEENQTGLRSEHENLKRQFNEGLRQFRGVCGERDTLKASEEKATEKIGSLETRLAELEKIRTESHEELETLRAELATMAEVRTQLADQGVRLVDIESERDELLETKRDAEKRIAQLTSEVAEQSATYDELDEKYQSTCRELTEITSERDELSQAKIAIQQQMEELTATIEEKTVAYKELNEQYETTCRQLAEVTSERDDAKTLAEETENRVSKLMTRHEELERARDAVESELAETKSLYSEKVKAHAEAIQECDELITASEQADERLVKQDERISELERIRDEVENDYAELKSKYEKKLDELRAAAAERDESREECRNAQDEVIELKRQLVEANENHNAADSELTQLRSQYELATKQLADEYTAHDQMARMYQESEDVVLMLKQQLDELEKVHGTVDVEHAEIRAKYEALKSEFEAVKTARDEVTASYKEAQQTMLDLKEQIVALEAEKDSAASELNSLRTDYDIAIKDAEVAQDQHQQLCDKYTQSESTIVLLREQIKQLEEVRGSTDGDLAELRAKYDEKLRELDEVVEGREELVATNKEAENKVTRLEVRVQQLEKLRDEASSELVELRNRLSQAGDLKRSLAEQNRRLEILVNERDNVTRSKSEVELRLEQLESELEQQNRSFQTINEQHVQLKAKLKLENERYELAAEELEAQRKRVEQLESELEEFDVLRQEHVELQTQLTDIKDRLRRMTDERDEQRSERRKLEGRVVSLRRHNVANEETIRDLRRERMAVIERLRNRALVAQQESQLKVVRYEEASPTGGRMEHDAALGMVYTEAPDDPDDLKLIYGIATVLEQKLNEFGVYTYRQIMEWDESTIEEFSARLAFKDRIQRDGWIQQATRLHEEKYGQPRRAA